MIRKLHLYVITLFCLAPFVLSATHIVGGTLTYVYNGGSNYTITLKLYRDCGAGTASFPGSVTISVLGFNGATFAPSRDITMNLGPVTVIPSNLSPCAVAPSPLPCVQEGIYTKTVNNLPPNPGGYHLYYQVVARNLSLTNINGACNCIGESFYAYIPGISVSTGWLEDFTLANGTTVDNGTTAWSIAPGTTPPASANVNNNLFEITGANNSSLTWTSQSINIASCGTIDLNVNLSESGTLDPNDSISVYYRLNGGPLTLFPVNGFKADDFTSALSTATGLSGTTVQIVIRVRYDANSPNSEIYRFDNIIVSCFGSAFVSNSDPVFTQLPPLFLCVNQPFSFNHAATDADGDSLVYSLYTPYDGDAGVGALDPTFFANVASFTPVTWLGGFSTNNPLGGSPLSLNPSTGLLSGTPTMIGQFVVGVKVKEYRNGVYLSETLRDVQFNVLNCPQPPPAITATNISVNDGCIGVLKASGITTVSATWNSVGPGVPGTYNNFLSCTSGCLNTTVTPIGIPPAYIDYLVCGNSISCAGTYVCDTVRVTFNPTLGVNIIPTNPTLCFGQTSTTLSAIGTGGTPPYNYLWNNVNPTQTINVGVGTYNIKVTDASGCPPAFNSVSVTSYSVPITANAGPDKTVCGQFPLATLNGTVVGATGGIWSGGTGTFSPNNTTLTNLNYSPTAAEIASGAVTLTLTSTGNGNCPAGVDVVVIHYANFSATITNTVVNVSCFGGNNGSAIINLTGGSSPFTYTWTTLPAQNTSTATNLSPGTYSVNIIDGIGCIFQTSVTVTQPLPLSINSTVTNVSCNSGSNGSITLAPAGGNVPYSYAWNSGQTTPTITALGAGIFTVTVTDARGCTGTGSYTVTQPTAIVSAFSSTNVSCFNGINGAVTSTVSGGTPAYTYSWSPSGNTSANLSGVQAGTYTLNITDTKGCLVTRTVSITQPAVLLAATSVTNESCDYSNNGQASLIASGGTPGYTYLWQPGAQTTSTLTNLSSGIYSVTVTDTKGCTTTTFVTVTEPPVLTAAITSKGNVSCFGGNNGFATVAGSGGTPNYTYLWTPGGSTSPTANSLTVGTYTVAVTDTKACTTQTTVTITQPSSLTIAATSTNVSCNSGNNGAITVTPAGGTSPYTYSWLNNAQTTPTTSSLTAGIYTIVVTDAKGCSNTGTYTVTQPAIITSAFSSTNISCFSGTNGAITSTVSGGTPTYSYVWNPSGSTSPNLSGVQAGTYTLNITDSKSCLMTKTVTLTQPTAILAVTSVTNETCNYSNNGKASVTPSGGTPGYTYLWQPGAQTTSTVSSLSSGNYSVIITDTKGCITTKSITITEPAALTASISTKGNVSCFGGNNGFATVAGAGGTPNYTYLWSPGGATTATSNSLTAGTYTIVLTDTKACTTQTTVTITQPAVLTVVSSITNVNCNGISNGAISVSPVGGTGPYSHILQPGNIPGNSFNNLTAGNYTIITTDGNGCSSTNSITISEPTSISTVISFTNSNCGIQNGMASISITAGGAPPFNYSWLPAGGTNSVTTSLFAGSYSVNVTDNNGCVSNNIVNINDVEGPTVSILSNTNVSCYGGSDGAATAAFTGGTGPNYTYLWIPSGGNALTATNLTTGLYVIQITDNSGCLGLATTTLISQPTPISLFLTSTDVSCFGGSNGTADVSANGGTPGYTYNWLPGGLTGASVTNLTAANYTVTVTDNNNCPQVATLTISQPTAAVSLAATATSVSCFGGTNGSTSALASGGTSPYNYDWLPGTINGATNSNLTAGVYTVTATDANGCSLSNNSVTVIEPTALTLVIGSLNSNCSLANGQASVTISGGINPYTYQWSPTGGSNAIANNLLAGPYSVSVNDFNGCNITNSVVVTDAPTPTVVVTTNSNVSCFGGANGSVTATVGAGTGPYTYSWSPSGGTNNTASNLPMGTYTVLVSATNGCTITANSSLITQPLPVITNVTANPVSCFGSTNGSASVTVTGGVPAYSYSWSPGGSTATSVTNLSSGSYTLNVTDANNCIHTALFAITQPTVMSVNSAASSNVSCFGGNSGSATVTVNGGTLPYSYNWLPYGGNGPVATGLIAGTYTVNISDFNNCSTSTIFAISQPTAALTATTLGNPVACFGGSSGTASVTVSGGTSGYSYQWSPSGGTGPTASGLSNGTYFVSVTDVNSCQTSASILISQIPLLTATLVPINAACGLPNGSISTQISGGTAPYTYTWSPGAANTSSISGLAPGSYTLQLSDVNNCLQSFSTSLINLPSPVLSVTASNSISCYGNSTGASTISISSGNPPFSINWQPFGGSNLSATALVAGTYTASVTDSRGCLVSINSVINQPSAPLSVSSVSITDALCFGTNTGTVAVSVTGGTPAYTYSWTPNTSTASSVTNLAAGNYTIFIKDLNNCATGISATVGQPTILTTTITSVVNAICYNSHGSIDVLAGGGQAPYSYAWSTTPLQTASSATNISAGSYSVTVADAHGCTSISTATITQPTLVYTSASVNDTICVGQTGSISALGSGGAGNYYYAWLPSGAINIGTLTISPTVNTTYTVVAFDQNGCAGLEDSVTIIVYDLNASSLQISGQSPICPGQSTFVSAQTFGNTGPITVSWNNGLSNGTGPYTVQPSQPTTYVVTVSGSCGVSVSDSIRILFNPPPIIGLASDTAKSCAPGVINFFDSSVTGNPSDPINSWTWDFGDGSTSALPNPSHIFNLAGTYTVNLTVTTDGGCTASSTAPIVVSIYQPPIASFTVNSTNLDLPYDVLHATNQSIGGTIFNWDFGDGVTSNSLNGQHLYTSIGGFQIELVALNQFGCSDTAKTHVTTHADVVFPNVFTPNPNGSPGSSYNINNLDNDLFFPYTSGVIEYKLQIFDRWGELIFETEDVKQGWDGYYKGTLSQLGVYVWKAHVKLNNGKEFNKSGDLTLLR